jgi:hypothetical protein
MGTLNFTQTLNSTLTFSTSQANPLGQLKQMALIPSEGIPS